MSTTKRHNPRRVVLAAMFLAIGYVLPFLTGQIPKVGAALCPMHIPVLLCGFFCGGGWGLAVGLILPLLRSFTLGVPVLFPKALCMALELGTYGAVAGGLYARLPGKKRSIYLSLLAAMLAGRLVWGAARFACTGLDASRFGLAAFWSGAVATAVPGIAVQLLLIPVLVMAVQRKESGNNAGCPQVGDDS